MNDAVMSNEAPAVMILVAAIDAGGLFARLMEHEEGIALAADEIVLLPPEPRVALAWAWRDGRWLRRAALLDADNVFLGVEEVEPDKLTARHLPQLFNCDNQPMRYRWVPDRSSEGGSLQPLPRQTPEQKFLDTEPLPAIALFFIRVWATKFMVLPPKTEAWLDWYVRTTDFMTYRDTPEVMAFIIRNEGSPT